jgi:hypothetical protein
MDAALTPCLRPALVLGAIAAVLVLSQAVAQERDPTKPPAVLSPRASRSAPAESSAPARLSMIVRGHDDVRSAVIDGQLVHVGESVLIGGVAHRVTRISDNTVVLALAAETGATQLTLELLPDAERPPDRLVTHAKTGA